MRSLPGSGANEKYPLMLHDSSREDATALGPHPSEQDCSLSNVEQLSSANLPIIHLERAN